MSKKCSDNRKGFNEILKCYILTSLYTCGLIIMDCSLYKASIRLLGYILNLEVILINFDHRKKKTRTTETKSFNHSSSPVISSS